MLKNVITTIAVSTLFLFLFSINLHAAPMVFDRGLPTDNLNNEAGNDRSNVAWGFYDDEGTSYYSGDDFNITETNQWGQWLIQDFTVWFVNPYDNANDDFSLYIGEEDTSIVSDDFTVSQKSYIDGSTYLGSSGYDIDDFYELTFNDVNFTANQNQLYNFTVTSSINNPFFLHASNADLSGSTQEGANDLYKWFYSDGTYGGEFDSDGYGWDKSSDINLQITANAVPEPTTWLLFGTGLLGLLGFGRKKFLKKA